MTRTISSDHAAAPYGRGRWPVPAYYDTCLVVGFAALAIPTLVHLAQSSWSTDAGAHGPIVLSTAIWLIWRNAGLLSAGQPKPLWPGAAPLILALPLYVIGRVTSILMLEGLAVYLVMLTLIHLRYGNKVLRGLWFPLVYMLFLITPPENWIFVATRPLKMGLSELAVGILSGAGLSVGSAGNMIQVDGYQLLVASACSGLNSLIGITAIGLFYVYLRRGSEPRYSLLLVSLLLPVALVTNLLRIIGLVIATHFLGPGAVEGLIHDAAGIVTFVCALFILLAVDAGLFPLYTRLRRRALG